jgi:hypothetical protein
MQLSRSTAKGLQRRASLELSTHWKGGQTAALERNARYTRATAGGRCRCARGEGAHRAHRRAPAAAMLEARRQLRGERVRPRGDPLEYRTTCWVPQRARRVRLGEAEFGGVRSGKERAQRLNVGLYGCNRRLRSFRTVHPRNIAGGPPTTRERFNAGLNIWRPGRVELWKRRYDRIWLARMGASRSLSKPYAALSGRSTLSYEHPPAGAR